MKKKLSAILFSSLVACTFSSMRQQQMWTYLSDGTFQVFLITIFQSIKRVTRRQKLTVSQILAGGNPGSALQIETQSPKAFGQSLSTAEYLINTTFRYDPTVQGAMISIDATIDASGQVLADGSPVPFHPLGGSNGGGLVLVRQAGNIYTNLMGVTGPPVVGSGDYSTGHATGLKAADFGLVTDLLTFTVDKTQNPSFSSGILELGSPDTLRTPILLASSFLR